MPSSATPHRQPEAASPTLVQPIHPSPLPSNPPPLELLHVLTALQRQAGASVQLQQAQAEHHAHPSQPRWQAWATVHTAVGELRCEAQLTLTMSPDQNHSTLSTRPALSRWQLARLALRVAWQVLRQR